MNMHSCLLLVLLLNGVLAVFIQIPKHSQDKKTIRYIYGHYNLLVALLRLLLGMSQQRRQQTTTAEAYDYIEEIMIITRSSYRLRNYKSLAPMRDYNSTPQRPIAEGPKLRN